MNALYTLDAPNPLSHVRTVLGLHLGDYPDGMPLLHGPELDRSPRVILARPQSLSDLMAILFWVDALQARGHEAPELILPNVPGSRQDRLNPEGDYLFTLRSVAAAVNARKFPRVTVLDPHSLVTPALIDRCWVVPSAVCAPWVLRDDQYDAVVSPDAGAEKRAGEWARALNVPLVRAWKTRDVRTGSLTGFGMEPTVRGQHVLVVDDLCDGGGTFTGLQQEVLNKRATTADLFVTHGLFTKGLEALQNSFHQIITTDSVVQPEGVSEADLTVIPVCLALLEGRTV